jgi:hypothetical protein
MWATLDLQIQDLKLDRKENQQTKTLSNELDAKLTRDEHGLFLSHKIDIGGRDS